MEESATELSELEILSPKKQAELALKNLKKTKKELETVAGISFKEQLKLSNSPLVKN